MSDAFKGGGVESEAAGMRVLKDLGAFCFILLCCSQMKGFADALKC